MTSWRNGALAGMPSPTERKERRAGGGVWRRRRVRCGPSPARPTATRTFPAPMCAAVFRAAAQQEGEERSRLQRTRGRQLRRTRTAAGIEPPSFPGRERERKGEGREARARAVPRRRADFVHFQPLLPAHLRWFFTSAGEKEVRWDEHSRQANMQSTALHGCRLLTGAERCGLPSPRLSPQKEKKRWMRRGGAGPWRRRRVRRSPPVRVPPTPTSRRLRRCAGSERGQRSSSRREV